MSTQELHSPEELQAMIDHMPAVALDAAEGAMGETLLFLHGKLPGYPSGPRPKVSQYWTPKQRRWFFAALRRGDITVPYKRTGTLGRSFTTEVKRDTGGVTGELGTNVNYAPWVVGPSYPGEEIRGRTMWQARVHSGLWFQLGTEFDKNLPEAEDIFAGEFFDRFMAGV